MQSGIAIEQFLSDGWSVTALSAANAAGAATKAASNSRTHYITGFSAVVSDAAVGSNAVDIQLKDDTTVIWAEIMPGSSSIGTSIYRTFPTPIKITTGAAASINSGAAGSGCKIRLNLNGYTI